MARIVGVDLPKNKRGEIGLTYIYGIGLTTSQKMIAEIGTPSGLLNSGERHGQFFAGEVNLEFG